ncbi:MAG: 16S rRNA (cytidine(1402)-2'-O)-methyltransferase [Longimicrobiales bacterium]
MATLYVVSTPIGNLEDISQRALRVLKEVDRVLAEDTRHTATLFRRYDIGTPLVSAHMHNEAGRSSQVVGWLEAGENLALVSDAGTPLLSDPGARIVNEVIAAGHTVVPIPGASALLSALVGSGLDAAAFTFFGFPPRTGSERKALLQRIASLDHTAVLYEAPPRVHRLLADLAELCEPERGAVVARELTKVHETFERGTLQSLATYYEAAPPRGEVVVLVAGGPGLAGAAVAADPAVVARTLLDEGGRPSNIARELARRLGMSRNEAYQIVLAVAEPGDRAREVEE